MLSSINRFFEQIPDFVQKNRLWVWGGFVIATGILLFGLGRVKTEMNMDSYFQENEPVKRAYDHFRAIFGGDEIVYLVFEAKNGDVFSQEALKALQGVQRELLRSDSMTNEASPLNHITKVTSILNVNYLQAKDDILSSRDFIGETLPENEAERMRIRTLADAHPDYPLLYFSKEHTYGGIMIETDFNAVLAQEIYDESNPEEISIAKATANNPSEIDSPPTFQRTEMPEYALFMDEVTRILHQEKYADALKFYPAGNPVMMSNAIKTMMKEAGVLMMGLPILIAIMLWLLFRSLATVIWPILIIAFSLLWVVGLAGWIGIPLSQLFEIIVFLTLAVGVADAVHILSGYLYFRNQNLNHDKALRQVYKKSGLACFLTSVTTAVGLCSLIFVPLVPIQNFGILAAIGVLLAFIFTVFLLPNMLHLWNPISQKKLKQIVTSRGKPHLLQNFLQRIEHFSGNRPKLITGVFLLFGLALAWGSLSITVDSNFVRDLKKTNPTRVSYDIIDRFMGGSGNMATLIDTGKEGGIKDPRIMNAIETLQIEIEKQFPDKVKKTFSLANVVKESFRLLNGGDQEAYRLPQERMLLAQTLFLFENASPEDRQDLVSENYRTTHIRINITNMGSHDSVILMKDIQHLIETIFFPLKQDYPHLTVNVTGQIPLMNRLSDFISRYQLQSFLTTLSVISLLLLFIFGSIKVGAIAIIPNLFPIVTIFGLMGFLGIPLDMHLMLVAPITIGIAVDDTIHFLAHYRLERENNANKEEAIQNAFREAGQAILFTSIILSVGFMIFLISSSKGLIFFGIFSGLAIFVALLADLFLLPSMLFLFEKSNKDMTR